MTRIWAVVPLALALGMVPVHGQQQGGPHWSVLALKVEKADPDDRRPFRDRSTTQIRAVLHLPGKSMVGIDVGESTITSIADDQGTDLLAADRNGATPLIAKDAQISMGGRLCGVAFSTAKTPAAGATRVRVKGTLVVLVGKGEKRFERDNVALRLGLELPAGTLKFTGTGSFSGTLTYTGKQPVKDLTLFNEAGKEITLPQTAHLKGVPLGGKGKSEQHFRGHFPLPSGLSRANVRVTYFEAVEKVTVPIDLEIGVGL